MTRAASAPATTQGKSGAERTVKLVLSYDGTNYCGWETQKNGLAIQEVLEKAIQKITGETVEVEGSGRTDAGVHALGQVASFRFGTGSRPGKLVLALNATIPKDIAVVDGDRGAAGLPRALRRDLEDLSLHDPERSRAAPAAPLAGLSLPSAARRVGDASRGPGARRHARLPGLRERSRSQAFLRPDDLRGVGGALREPHHARGRRATASSTT